MNSPVQSSLHTGKSILIGLFFIAMLIAQILLAPKSACVGPQCPCYSIVHFEFASNAVRACEILSQWVPPASRSNASAGACGLPDTSFDPVKQMLWWDFGFAMSYALLGFVLMRWSQQVALRSLPGKARTPTSANIARCWCWLPVVAGACDFVENGALLRYLDTGIDNGTLSVAAAFAGVKFALLVAALLIFLLTIAGARSPRLESTQ